MSKQIKVDHAFNDLEEGQTYIMTLKDSEVLGGESSDSEGQAVVENVNLQGLFKQKILQKRQHALLEHTTKKFLPSSLNEDEDWSTPAQKILQKYDDIAQVAEDRKQKFSVSLEQENDPSNQLSKLNFDKSQQQTLEIKKTFGSDYIVESEVPHTGFKKRSVPLKRQREDEDLVSFLEQNQLVEQASLMTKSERHNQMVKQKETEMGDRVNKAKSFIRAYDRASKSQSDKLLLVDDDEYNRAVQTHLQKARQQSHQNSKEIAVEIPTFIQQEDESVPEGAIVFDTNLESISTRAQGVIAPPVISAQTNLFTLKSVKTGITSVVNIMMPSQRIKTLLQNDGLTKETNQSAIVKQPENQLKEENKINDVGDEDGGLNEIVIGKGIGNALKVFRERGMLGRDFHHGRTLDKTLEQQLNSFKSVKPNVVSQPAKEVKEVDLQYFDKKGRKLTLKEAYRQMCWKFHGKMPSHSSRQKLEKKEEVQVKIQAANNALNFGSNQAKVSSRPRGGALGSLVTKKRA